MNRLMLALALLGACKKRAEPLAPPPISDGKCLADLYEGRRAVMQVCTFAGYAWKCENEFKCTRLPEPIGERLPVK
jgi:hypothetical protein